MNSIQDGVDRMSLAISNVAYNDDNFDDWQELKEAWKSLTSHIVTSYGTDGEAPAAPEEVYDTLGKILPNGFVAIIATLEDGEDGIYQLCSIQTKASTMIRMNFKCASKAIENVFWVIDHMRKADPKSADILLEYTKLCMSELILDMTRTVNETKDQT